eukprot:gnl/MRDRNA2_/MRDRNA2_100061_c0_seq1.p1 gnl/MRDRNA2_/MRDRNA2_100061_c0~~gnl/MRDRNA2_/MRDRNA2_100061_c0_seq1.p1  ORF type:complete len:115 (-),score=14.75 gnl/MRDRNA2_/MRDRNA2_100061_c0_seq1:127-471(-)
MMWILGAISAALLVAPHSLFHESTSHHTDVVLGPKTALHEGLPRENALMLVQEGLHSRRMEHSRIRGSPLENQPTLYGLPKIVIVIVADVLAMLCFLACIPMMLVLSKRRQPMQ